MATDEVTSLRAEVQSLKNQLADQKAKASKDLADIARAHSARCQTLQTLNDVLSKQLRKMFDRQEGERLSEQAPIESKEIQVTPASGRGYGHE